MNAWLFYIWLIIEILLVIATGSLWIAAPESLTLNISLSVFVLVLGILLAYPRRVDFLTWIRSRQFVTALGQILQFFLIAAIAGLINHLVWRYPHKWDLTETKLNTLSDQSLRILQDLPKDVTVTFFSRRENWSAGMRILDLYRDARPDLKLEAVDIEASPQRARAENIVDNGTVLVRAGERRVTFVLKDELSVTNAFLKLIRTRPISIYFTVGHGEAMCDMKGEGGISAFCDHLKGQLYELKTLDLQRIKDVPSDADLVVVWGPTLGLLPEEVLRLQRWLERGGSLLVMLSPGFLQDTATELRGLTLKWGLKLNNDLVIDRLSTLENNEATIPIISKYGEHPITKNFAARTLFPLSSSVETLTPLYSNVATTPLASTSGFPGSWAERDLPGIARGKAEFNEAVDLKGPIHVAAVAERLTDKSGEKDTRIGVIGNDSFTRNAYQNQTANANFLLNMVGWLAHDEGLLSLSRPGLSRETVILSAMHINVVFFLVVVTMPILAFTVAIWIYRRRRKL